MTEVAVNTPFIESVKSERDSKLSERKRILDAFKKQIAIHAAQGSSSIAFSLSECYQWSRDPEKPVPGFDEFNSKLLYLTHDLLSEGFKIAASFSYTLNLVVEW